MLTNKHAHTLSQLNINIHGLTYFLAHAGIPTLVRAHIRAYVHRQANIDTGTHKSSSTHACDVYYEHVIACSVFYSITQLTFDPRDRVGCKLAERERERYLLCACCASYRGME